MGMGLEAVGGAFLELMGVVFMDLLDDLSSTPGKDRLVNSTVMTFPFNSVPFRDEMHLRHWSSVAMTM
jgi:hypothetical protein